MKTRLPLSPLMKAPAGICFLPVGCSSSTSKQSPPVHGITSLSPTTQTSVLSSFADQIASSSAADVTQVLVIFTPRLFATSEAVASNWKVAAVPGQPANALTCSATLFSPTTRCCLQGCVYASRRGSHGTLLTLYPGKAWGEPADRCGTSACMFKINQTHEGSRLTMGACTVEV